MTPQRQLISRRWQAPNGKYHAVEILVNLDLSNKTMSLLMLEARLNFGGVIVLASHCVSGKCENTLVWIDDEENEIKLLLSELTAEVETFQTLMFKDLV